MRHRFHSICPYFAMFPEEFAEEWIERCTEPGDLVLDPFAGRGTGPFQALLMGRTAIGADVNPVAFVLTGAKLESPAEASVVRRLTTLEDAFRPSREERERQELSAFFKRAFHHETLRQLLYLRRTLAWKDSRVDRFIAALVLGSLHGEMDKSHSYFSNQMPRTISTKPLYSLAFWNRHSLWPRARDVFQILRDRLAFRYETPPPTLRGKAHMSDVRYLHAVAPDQHGAVEFVITSPPYLDVTNFEEDQWLRLWFLGGEPRPCRGVHSRDDRHERPEKYWSFLCDAWRGIRPLLAERSTFVCRIGGRGAVVETVRDALVASMRFLARRWRLRVYEVSQLQRRQTDLFRPGSIGCRFEVDFCFDLVQ